MTGYSGTPLPQKLGMKPELTVTTINAPTNYRRLLGTIPEGVTFSDRLKPDSNFVHLFIKKTIHLARENCGHRNSLGFLAKEIVPRADRRDRRRGPRRRAPAQIRRYKSMRD
jgi:hypothetical protein